MKYRALPKFWLISRKVMQNNKKSAKTKPIIIDIQKVIVLLTLLIYNRGLKSVFPYDQ